MSDLLRNTKALQHTPGDRVMVRLYRRVELGTVRDLGPSATGDSLYWIELDSGTVTTATDSHVSAVPASEEYERVRHILGHLTGRSK